MTLMSQTKKSSNWEVFKRRVELEYEGNELFKAMKRPHLDKDITMEQKETQGRFEECATKKRDIDLHHDNVASRDVFDNDIAVLPTLDMYMTVRQRKPQPKSNITQRTQVSDLETRSTTSAANSGKTQALRGTHHRGFVDDTVLSALTTELPDDVRHFVFSTSILVSRNLLRRILSLYPSARIIERDRSVLPQNHTPQPREPVRRAEATTTDLPLNAEADILFSPDCGVLHSTLQKVKQRALPGQERPSGRTEAEDHVAQVALQVERLYVLLVLPITSMCDIQDLSESDLRALNEFTAFCSILPSAVSVIAVAGEEEAIAKWIVALMIKHSIPARDMHRVEEESVQESFLRKAGMNAYAAQSVLSKVKEIVPGATQRSNALDTFLAMSFNEKSRHFERSVGVRALKRVHEICEARW